MHQMQFRLQKRCWMGVKIIKFFPANVYGGLAAMKKLAAPFTDIRFIPTGGINQGNLEEYAKVGFVFAVGGSWMCSRKEIAERKFGEITEKCKVAREAYLGYEVAHVGINTSCGADKQYRCGNCRFE